MPSDQLHSADAQYNTVAFHTPRLSKERLGLLEVSLDLLLSHGKSMREVLDSNLDLWSNMYDMRVQTKQWPWPNSSNLFVPLIPTNVDTVASRLMQLVVPQRLFVVKGRTDIAEQKSNEVERWYNSKLIKNEWPNSIYQWVHLALRDGTAVMECVWEKKMHSMNLVVDEPVMDDETGGPLLDLEGQPVTKRAVRAVDITEYNDVRWRPVELRDFYLFPSWAISIEDAPTVGRVLYQSQAEMKAMVKAGTYKKEAVDYVLKTVTQGAELTQDDHTATYDAGGQIDVSTPSWTETMDGQQAAYFKVWRLHTREFDLDGDGVFEENVLYYHEYTKTLLGWHHYQYAHGRRPFVAFSPLERPNRFYGYSVCERLYGLQIELNSIHNQRRDEIDLRLSPPILRTSGATPTNDKQPWGPGIMWDVGSMQDLQLMQLPDVPSSTWQEEIVLGQLAEKLLGLSEQMMGQNAGGRRTKYEMQVMSAAVSVRMSLMASRLQRALQALFTQTHELELQYAPEQIQEGTPGTPPRELNIDKQILGLDYELGINGMGSPLDRQARRQELLFLYNLLLQNPLVQSSLARVFALTRRILEEFEVEDTISIIGTEEQAMQLQQAMQQQPAGGGGGQPEPNNRKTRRAAQQSAVPGVP